MVPHILTWRSSFDASTTRHELREQFINPSDVFSVLLVVGPDVRTQALAQLTDVIISVEFSQIWMICAVSIVVMQRRSRAEKALNGASELIIVDQFGM